MKAWRVNPTRSALLAAVALLLAGCTVTPDMVGFLAPSSCAKIEQKAVKFINWTKVPVVNVRIRQNEYLPMVIRLRQGWPYVIRILNRDDYGHVFQANTFFSRVAVIKTTIAGKVKELHTVLAEAGRDPGMLELTIWQAPRDLDQLMQLQEFGVTRAVFGLPPVEPEIVIEKLDKYAGLAAAVRG